MKLSRVLFVVIISLAMYLCTFTEMKSQCLQGYNQSSVRIWVGDCEYEVTVCYKCEPSTYSGSVHVISFRKIILDCPTSLNTSQILEEICQQVYDYEFIKINFCNIILIPCLPYDGGIWYSFYREMCFMKVFQPDGTILYTVCHSGNTYCTETYKICYDPTFPPTFTRKTLMYGPEISGYFECYGVNEPPDPTGYEQYPTCFEVHTPCNP